MSQQPPNQPPQGQRPPFFGNMQPPQEYPQGYQPQPQYQQLLSRPQQPQAQAQKSVQEIKFYKSGFLGFSSAPGRFQRDVPKMAQGNWRVGRITHLGRNLLGQQTICVIYEK